MQWLIDLIIEAIGIPPVYVERPHTISWDFTKADFPADDTWYEYDLSSIIPEGTSAVNIYAIGAHANINKHIKVSPVSPGIQRGATIVRTSVANISSLNRMVIGVTATRTIWISVQDPAWNSINVQVKGWFLGGF